MSFVFDYNSFQNLDTLLRYQNHLLVRKIAQEKKWPLEELKKLIPNKVDKKTSSSAKKARQAKSKPPSSVDEPNFKVIQKKVVKKKIKKITPTKQAKKKPVSESKSSKSETSPNPDLLEKEKPKSSKPKKRVRKIVKKSSAQPEKTKTEEKITAVETTVPKEGEVEVMLIQINEEEYYLDPSTDKVYQKDGSGLLIFVGMKEGDNVNLDAESAEE